MCGEWATVLPGAGLLILQQLFSPLRQFLMLSLLKMLLASV